MSTGLWDDASRTFDTLLADKPTNVVALLGKVRLLSLLQTLIYNFLDVGQDCIYSSAIFTSPEAVPEGLAIESQLSSRPAYRNWSVSLGDGSQG